MAVDRVRHVGEAVAAVVAENRYVAEDACDLIEVEYEDLPVVVDPEAAMNSSGDAVLHPERGPTNIAQQRTLHVRTRAGGLRQGRRRGRAQAPLAAARARSRSRRSARSPYYESGTGKFNDLHQQLVPQLRRLAGRRLARRAGAQAQPDPGDRPAAASAASSSPTRCITLTAHARSRVRPAGQVPGGPARQHHELRQPRLGPHLPLQARAEARRDDAVAAGSR